MLDNDIRTIDPKEEYPLTNVVILKKGLNGVVQANQIAYVHLLGSATCFQCNRQEKKAERCKPQQIIEENLGPRVVKKESIVKRFTRVMSIILTVGGALFLVKHKQLKNFTKTWKSKCKG